MSLVMLTEPAKFTDDGEGVRVKLVSGSDEWTFCLSRHHFWLSVERARRQIEDIRTPEGEVVAFCEKAAH